MDFDYKVIVNGDVIEVRLFDNTYTPYFKGRANINNKRQMDKLIQDLHDKGVSLVEREF